MTLVFGMNLAYAAPILLTFDWTGQCDDCQGPNGAIDVPGTNMKDGYTQDVSGLLKLNYDPDIDPLLAQFEFVSFVYNGSSILHKFEALGFSEGVDVSKALTVLGDSVVVTSTLTFDAHAFTYKGDFMEWKALDFIYTYCVNPDLGVVLAFCQVSEVKKYKIWMEPIGDEAFWAGVDYDLRYSMSANANGPSIGDDGGRGGGSRDIGYDSKFVMRGTLPSPLANPVPEPSTIALFALGVLGLSLRRKKCA